MSSYIHFTEEQKQRAAAVNLEEFLRCRGEKLLSSGREKRLASDHSVTVRGNEWYDHAEERGGHAVSFVQRFYGLSYPDAVTMLLGGELGTAYPSAGERTEEPVKSFALPPANKDMRRVFAYLIKHRGIARDVVAHFAKAGLLYEDAEYHNAVFVGTDTDGVPRHAHKRSANSYGKAFRLNVEGSDPRYSFHYVGTDRSLYVFEAPIDMLSFITLYPENWQRHSYVACCGTSIQPVLQMLEQVPQLDTVLFCLDNDEAGHQASRRMQNQLEVRYSVERLIPENKDWNDDLTLNSENAQGLAMNEMRRNIERKRLDPDRSGSGDVPCHRRAVHDVSSLYSWQYQIPHRRRRAARYSQMGHRQGNQADLCPCALQGQRMAPRTESPHGAGIDPRLQGATAGAHRTGGQR